jgi:UDP-glucose 4-epimerase
MSKRPNWWLTVLARIWPLTWISARATNWPVAGKIVKLFALPLFTKKNLNISYIPINEEMGGPKSTYLPREVASELIRRSAHRVIIERCTCRDAKQCTNYPIDYGCTLLGEGTKEIDPRIAKHVSIDEALSHLQKTLDRGLIPMIGRVKLDNFIWGVRDRGKLLTICHCCRCCCTIFASGKYLPKEAADSLIPLTGITISIDDDACTRCETCVTECFMGALSLDGGKIVRDEASCKACGRCVTICPQGAVSVTISDVQKTADLFMDRIKNIIDYE